MEATLKSYQDQLVKDHMYIAKIIASKYTRTTYGYEDLIQEGCIGLIKAAAKFDKSYKVKFSTYASFWVKQAIFEALTSKSRTIRLPSHIVSLKLKVFKFRENFLLSLGFEPDVAIIAKELKIDAHLVDQVLNLTTEYTGSWEPASENLIEAEVEQSDTLEHTIEAIRKLSKREKLILAMKFGILKDI